MWRHCKPGDEESVVAMCLALYREDPAPRPVEEAQIRGTLEALRFEPSRGRVAVLELEGRVEGYAFLISFWSNELGGELCYLDELYVKPGSRGKGCSTNLIESLAVDRSLWPRKPVAIDLEVTPANERARAFYGRLGFEPAKNAHMRLRR